MKVRTRKKMENKKYWKIKIFISDINNIFIERLLLKLKI